MELEELKNTLKNGVPTEIEVASEEEAIDLHKKFDAIYEEELDKKMVAETEAVNGAIVYAGKKINVKVAGTKEDKK